MNESLTDDLERFTGERGEGGRRMGRLIQEGYLTTHSLFSSDADDGGQKKKKTPRKLSGDLDTESESVFLYSSSGLRSLSAFLSGRGMNTQAWLSVMPHKA